MGSFVFKWVHPASEVYVTGTFDDWKKTEKLDKVGDHFEKNVTLPSAESKIYYKFVVDGNWITADDDPKEIDESGNENNVLTPERIVTEAPATAAIMSSAAPESTTAALAADAPLEKKEDETPATNAMMSSAAPESTTAALAADAPLEKKEEQTSDLPGAFPETPALELELGVKPMPAAEGAVNPIRLAPGEKIPEDLAAGSTTTHVKLDAESYEKSDALPGGLPAHLASAAPEATTAALAASAPLEPKVPEVVKESQEKAHVEPEASAVPEEVKEKAQVESELKDKVAEAPTTSEGTAGQGTDKTEDVVTPGEAAASVAAAATAVGGAAVAGAYMAKDIAAEKAAEAATTAQAQAASAATQLPDSVKEKLPETVQNTLGTTAKEETREEVSPEVPTEVKQSITEAKKDPEAAANTEAVEEKKEMEKELLKEAKPAAAVDEPSKATSEAPNAEEAPATTNGASDPVTADPTTPAKPAEATASGSSSQPDGSPSGTEKKKKNRLSAMFGKMKSKLSNK
ncbi:hypothetical protein F4780DRAFT_773724 [Xylariomycetidae sp. FL0641]|nr:hypothetical protein F4780DRAFT_773724 [Xylariomycetidae sp. FL0641]